MASTSSEPSTSAVPVEDPSAGGSQGGIDRDVNSILANLNQEQLASIVAAARASENGQGGEDAFSTSAPDTSSILAALPPGLGQAASALTSLTASLKKDENDESTTAEAVADMAEAAAEDQQREEGAVDQQQHEYTEAGEGQEPAEGEAQAHVEGEQGAEQYGDQTQVEHADGVEKEGEGYADQTQQEGEAGDVTKLEDQSMQPGNESTDEYRNENATQAAIAAMESLAAQSSMNLYGQQQGTGRSSSQSRRRDAGPEAERMRKDQHKEVERKRREQISNGITELQAIVPGCDTKGINKTAIINAAVRYIQELKNNEASNIEKWTLEKLLMDQAMNDLQHQLEHVRKENSSFREQLGLPEPEEEPVVEHYGGEQEGMVGEAEGGDGQHDMQGDGGMGEEVQGHTTDDANLDPNLGKEVDMPVDEQEAHGEAVEGEQANGEEPAVANGVAAAVDEEAAEAGVVTESADDKTALAGHTRDAEAADIVDGETDTSRAKRTRHA